MRKIFVLTAALALMLAGCAKETIETAGDGNKPVIAYKSSLGQNKASAETRASEITDLAGLTAASPALPVWVYFNSGDDANTLFRKWSLNYLTDHWSYNGDVDVFHPQDGLAHYSVWPVTNVTTSDGGANLDNVATGPTFDYTVPAAHSAQDDLLYAKANTTYGTPTAGFLYYHALAQINFSVKGYTGAKITISNIHMGGGISDTGTFSFATGQWSDLDGDGVYSYSIEADTQGATPGQTTGDNSEVFFGNHDVSGYPKDVSHSNSLMLLPQSFTANDGAWFEFDYVLTDLIDVTVKSGTDVQVKLKGLPINVWEKGNRYRYTINFNTLNTISYTVDVDTWTPGNQANTPQQ